mgnify:CR=1 FL=1|jgi:hypothetical protein|tara:strand:+ start:321 stop:452 length:132 start_codon:yes stop_codon:yes gene_type:complete
MTEPLEPYSEQRLGVKVGGFPIKKITIGIVALSIAALIIIMSK